MGPASTDLREMRFMRPLDGVLLGLLALVYLPALLDMAQVWRHTDYYSHGFLVPVVAFWAATRLRRGLSRAPSARDPRGLLVIGAAIAAYLWGTLTGSLFAAGLSLVPTVAGALLYLRGSAWLRILVFPVGYLLFMVPLPEPWITPVIVELQLLVSRWAVELLQAAGMAILRQGNVIHLPGGSSLFVAEACSGITSIITLLPLGVFLAYFTERTLARRLVLVAAVIPLAMFGNLSRVVATIVATQYVGVEAATTGPLHEWAGVATYVLGCLALLGVGALMRVLIPPTAEPESNEPGIQPG